uniref:Uncharacterized protein n=1 Tax=Lotharella globosa TaxID=91324 RepID=A0A6V3UF11_9EUKA|mmetsp:Transcript_15127/g.28621  ORF Transcript_15127/g.28621 Transcript_15127/m.28621 type:complete len:225 (+) Transcript_15127:93-767(+)
MQGNDGMQGFMAGDADSEPRLDAASMPDKEADRILDSYFSGPTSSSVTVSTSSSSQKPTPGKAGFDGVKLRAGDVEKAWKEHATWQDSNEIKERLQQLCSVVKKAAADAKLAYVNGKKIKCLFCQKTFKVSKARSRQARSKQARQTVGFDSSNIIFHVLNTCASQERAGKFGHILTRLREEKATSKKKKEGCRKAHVNRFISGWVPRNEEGLKEISGIYHDPFY